MVKEIIWKPAHTFSEFSLLIDDVTRKGCNISTVNIGTDLAGVKLNYAILTASMMSVTGRELVFEGGKDCLPMLPTRLELGIIEDIIRDAKDDYPGFIENPTELRIAHEEKTIDDALELIDKHGHSKIPIVDRDNYFIGMFDQQKFFESDKKEGNNVKEIMIPFNKGKGDIAYTTNKNITIENARRMLKRKNADYLVVLDRQKRLQKLAFKKDFKPLNVGAAISTHRGWEKRVKSIVDAGADMISIDTSDGLNEYVEEVIKKYKQMDTGVPICGGNVITYKGAMKVLGWGADVIKEGMSSGSTCRTKWEKATGRAPLKSLEDVYKARNDFVIFDSSHRYAPLIADGGMPNTSTMIIALTMADAIMLGGWFNQFYEAAGEKYDKDGKITTDESKMVEVASYGEGSKRAKSILRYGHSTKMTYFPEGDEGTVPYMGRLKPNLNKAVLRIKAALVNTNAMDLYEFRKNARIEYMSPTAQGIVDLPHDMKVKKE